ncbi:Lysophospholipid acyltransferase 7 [Eumeta japonica]|uniref:Lysophospholipid acyltransferase 7 n=1 Tax=Eumeta variegata TaxID=151549 RepID=A0A4C1V475_EUMVA|nr:Lysophospholipid acyltransferase 7 [Eumeta japonica]
MYRTETELFVYDKTAQEADRQGGHEVSLVYEFLLPPSLFDGKGNLLLSIREHRQGNSGGPRTWNLLHAVLDHCPDVYVLSEEHNRSSFLYKMIYPWFVFTAFRFRIYSGMTLSECVCTSVGLGAYPVDNKNRAGHGPTVGYLKLKEITPEQAKVAQVDFKTIECMDVWGCETVVTLRESMKTWNKCVQYWVGMYIHKRFPVKVLK